MRSAAILGIAAVLGAFAAPTDPPRRRDRRPEPDPRPEPPPETPEERRARLARWDAIEQEERQQKAARARESEAERVARVLAATPPETLRHRARKGSTAAAIELMRRDDAGLKLTRQFEAQPYSSRPTTWLGRRIYILPNFAAPDGDRSGWSLNWDGPQGTVCLAVFTDAELGGAP